MYARSTTILGSPEHVAAGIEFVEQEIRPALAALEGWQGISLLIDRESGRGICTTSWESEAAMHDSMDALAPVWERAGEAFSGLPEVAEWEVALMHRLQHGAFCRVAWYRALDVDQARQIMKMGVTPLAEATPGFAGASMLINRESRLCCSTTSWTSREDAEAASDTMAGLRERAVTESGLEIVDFAEFDLVLAELRVPELL